MTAPSHDLNDCCQHCKCWLGDRSSKDGEAQGECHLDPPQGVGMVPRPSLLNPKAMDLQLIFGWPTVKALQWCSRFERAVEPTKQ
jgi:hypothetical protein